MDGRIKLLTSTCDTLPQQHNDEYEQTILSIVRRRMRYESNKLSIIQQNHMVNQRAHYARQLPLATTNWNKLRQ